MKFTPRPYQDECHQAIADAHAGHDSVLVEMATGLGKTVIFTRYASLWEQGRTLVICPQIQLIGQAAKKFRKETGIMPAIEQGENWSNEQTWARSPFVVASKQSLCSGKGSKRYERFKDVGLVICDEAHYCLTQEYTDMLAFFRDNGAKILGVTATAKRHDKRAMGQIFDHVAYQYGILQAITDGWLAPIKVTCLQLQKLDLSDVGTSTGFFGKDFNQKQLNEKLENPEVIYEIAAATARETTGQKTIVFCSSVDEAQAVAEYLTDAYQLKADWICADKRRCSDQKRTEVLKSFCDDPNGITHVCNVGILTTGFDYPDLMCIVNARPTKSLPLYTQILGRLTRACEVDGVPVVDFPGSTPDARRAAVEASRKPFGRMIDLVDNSLEHTIVTATDVLCGEWSLEVRNRVKDSILGEEDVDLDEAAEKATRELDEEKIAAQREAERLAEEIRRKERARLKAEAEFAAREVDPFSGSRRGTVQMRGNVDPATDKQLNYLRFLGLKDAKMLNISKRQAMRMIGQLKAGVPVSEVRRTNRLNVNAAPVKTSAPKKTGVTIDDINRMLMEA